MQGRTSDKGAMLARRDLDTVFGEIRMGKKRLNGSQTTLTIAQRRAFVAKCILVYRLSHREIHELMSEAGIINELTGKPWSIGTISGDVNALRDEWRISAASDMRQVFTEQLTENRLARQEAWSRGELDLVLRFLEQEIKLTGTAAPDKVEVSEGVSNGEAWSVYKQLSEIAERLNGNGTGT